METKKKNKVILNLTIDPDVREEFIKLSNVHGINRSKLLANYIKKWVDEKRDEI